MKKNIKIVLILFIGYFLGFVSILLIPRKTPFAYITLKNNSGKNIKFIKIIDESKQDIQLVENISNGETKALKFYVAGEGSYTMEVTFYDNSTISGGAYIETGYKITENIKSDKISAENNLNKGY